MGPKNMGTFHGAVKMGLANARGGVTGPSKASGTVNSVDTMGTGRKVSVGMTAPVQSGVNITSGKKVMGGKMVGGSKKVKRGVMGAC